MKLPATRALALAVMSLAPLAPAQTDEAAERARISRERAEAQARFEQRQRECAQRFAVTPCVEEARAEHRQALLQLRRQEGVLDEAQRKQRAAARLAAIEEKRRTEQERAVPPRAERQPAPLQLKPPRPPAAARPASAPASEAGAAAREQRSRARFEARQRDAQAHREEAVQRRAQRESKGKAASPLPDPAAR